MTDDEKCWNCHVLLGGERFPYNGAHLCFDCNEFNNIPYVPIHSHEENAMTKKRIQPIQPLYEDETGRLRFQSNKIVEALLKFGQKNGFGLNEIAVMDFPPEDREQFSQLHGYSLSGFSELSSTTDVTYDAAYEMYEKGISDDKARVKVLLETIENIKIGMRVGVAILYGRHPDDLIEVDSP